MVFKATAAKQYHVKGLVLYRAHFPIWFILLDNINSLRQSINNLQAKKYPTV